MSFAKLIRQFTPGDNLLNYCIFVRNAFQEPKQQYIVYIKINAWNTVFKLCHVAAIARKPFRNRFPAKDFCRSYLFNICTMLLKQC